jgi:outer membrane protein assembly complex protein YaeT
VAGIPAFAQAERHNGRRIHQVLLEPADQPLSRDQIGQSVVIRPGDTFTEVRLGEAVRRLFATGRYKDIEADVEETASGLVLTFRTTPAYFLSQLTIEGVSGPPSQAVLNSATRLDLGSEVEDETHLPAAVEGLRETLRANGYMNPKIDFEIEHSPRNQEAFLKFLIDPGVRARFAPPVFTGDPRKNEMPLVRATGWRKWWGFGPFQPATERRVQEGLEKLRSSYLKRNHLMSQVRLVSLDYDLASNTLRPTVEINAGPRVAVRTEGARLGKGALRDLLPIYQERTVDRELLVEGQNNLQSYFQSNGYFEAKVAFSVVDNPPGGAGDQVIRYAIDLGPRYKLVDLAVRGVEYFDPDTIRERLAIIPARFPQYRRGRFSRALVERDKDAIVELYRTNGFRDAKVEAKVEDNFGGKTGELGVTYIVDEGRQWFVSGLDMSGVDLKLVETIQGLVMSNPGQPFSVTVVATDRDNILNYYFNNGYPDASFDATIRDAADPGMVDLKYSVTEGRRYFVRNVLLNGLRATREDLVTSRLTVSPQDPLSQSSIVETQRRLYDLGIFARVAVAVQNPEGRERNKSVIMQLDEARKYSLNLGFGAEFGRIGGGSSFTSPGGAAGFGPRAQIGLSRLNFLGLGHTLSSTLRVSNFQKRVLVNYLAPQFRGNENVSLTVSSFFDRSRDVRTFTSTRFENAFQITQQLSRPNSLQYRVIFRDVSVDQNTIQVDPGLIPIYSRPVQVTVFAGSFIQDRRDDPLDSTRGFFNTIDAGYAPGGLSRKTSYSRITMRNSSYHRLSRSFILARTLTIGWLHNLESDPVPLPERYFAGGSTTHRGFPENQAGPRDLVTGFPIGGNSYIFHGTELRFPFVGTNLGAVLFHDFGNVYSSFDSISFRYRQRDRQDFDYAVHSFGLGFRVSTPVGPVRLDFSYAPNSPRFVGYRGTRDELISGGGQRNVPQRVNPFQFHFSIGQSF